MKTNIYRQALNLLTILFFLWGFLTCLNDILIPHLKSVFDMNYTQTMLIQFTFFGAYAVMSLPSSFLIGKTGYKNGIIIGLTVAALGAFLFYPAAQIVSYPLFLTAFFILASGITILQVAANPYVAVLGDPETASGRLNLTQAFNSLGTTIAPLLGGLLILGGTYFGFSTNSDVIIHNPSSDQISNFSDSKWQKFSGRDSISGLELSFIGKDSKGHIWFQTEQTISRFDGVCIENFQNIGKAISPASKGLMLGNGNDNTISVIDYEDFKLFQQTKAKTIQMPYIGLGSILLLIAIMFGFVKLPKIIEKHEKSDQSAFAYPHLVMGAIAIFTYVGAEVAIGSFLVSFLGESNIAAMPEASAAKMIALYWGGAMIGRFQGSIALSGDLSKLYRSLSMIGVLAGTFFLAFYLTREPVDALIFTGFAFINALAVLLGSFKPNKTLAWFAAFSVLFVGLTIFSEGQAAMWFILSVGLFNSIMFPTIFTLAIHKLGPVTSKGSGLLNTAIVGGAIIPFLMGVLADSIGIHYAFVLPMICYVYIFFYGLKGYKPKGELHDTIIND